jgi:hypothetical protein
MPSIGAPLPISVATRQEELLNSETGYREYISALDEMLGLMDYAEMYEARNLPVVALLKPEGSTESFRHWAILSGTRRRYDYRIRGISYSDGADGFTGRLSLDGRRLMIDGDLTDVDFARYTSHGTPAKGVFLNTLNGEFIGLYGPFDANEWVSRVAAIVAQKIEAGTPCYKALMASGRSVYDTPSATFASIKGWYRTYRHHFILAKHRAAFVQSDAPCALQYRPIARDVVALNREIGHINAAVTLAERRWQ